MSRVLKNTAFLLSFFIIIFFSLHQWIFYQRNLLDNTVNTLGYPIILYTHYIVQPIKKFFSAKKNNAALQAELASLRASYLDLLDATVQLTAINHYAESLKEIATFQDRYKTTKRILAKVVNKNIDPMQHYFLLNKGSNDGVEEDMVGLFQNHLVGHIYEVHTYYSKLRLITDEKSKVAAYAAKTNAHGIVRGTNKIDEINFTYVSHLFKIEDGDMVISSGEGLIYPEGFCLGKIIAHSLKEKELYYTITLEPLIKLDSLRWISLVSASKLKSF